MQEINLWLIRHGESTANTGLWSANPQDVSLTENGVKQAIAIAEKVIFQPDLIVISPFVRTQETAMPIIKRWPNTPVETWPIQELIYLEPSKFQNITLEQRHTLINNYWQQLDPLFCDGEGAESFAQFIIRLKEFQQRIMTSKYKFLLAIGHGQFFRAYQLGLKQGFAASSLWMQQFREMESKQPMKNGEIVKLLLKKSGDPIS